MIIFCLLPYRILASRTRFLESLTVTFINTSMYKTVGTLLFLKGERKGAKEEVTKILIDNSLLTGQISVPALEDEVPAFSTKICLLILGFFSF